MGGCKAAGAYVEYVKKPERDNNRQAGMSETMQGAISKWCDAADANRKAQDAYKAIRNTWQSHLEQQNRCNKWYDECLSEIEKH